MPCRRRHGCVAGTLLLLGACSADHFTVRPAPLWPFKQYAVSASNGPEMTAFYSRPDAEPRRLVVVVQSPPCAAVPDQPHAMQTISTSGVLWKQLSPDSAYIQFDRVGPQADAEQDCESAPQTTESWRQQAASTITAIRKAEGLRSPATLYFGLGEGAYVASLLAARDRHAAGLVLINGSGMSSGVVKLAPRVPVLIVHGSDDDRTALEDAERLFSKLVTRKQEVALVVLDAYSHDLNLGSDRPECFEAAMQLIAARARTMTAARSKHGLRERSDCTRVMREFADGR